MGDGGGQLAIPLGRQINVLVSKDENIADGLADTGIVSGAGGGKATHDLEVTGAGNAGGTGEATLEDDLVVRRGDERPVHAGRCPISAFCFLLLDQVTAERGLGRSG